MVKINRHHSRIPEWTKLPQYKSETVTFYHTNDVEMEVLETAMEEKLVLPQVLRRKRPRAEVSTLYGPKHPSTVLTLS